MSEQELSESRLYLNKSNIHKVEPPILAIDYGYKNIGLAITDQKGIVAQPLTTIKVKDKNYKVFFTQLLGIINEYKVKSLVLGLPQAFKKNHLQNTKRILEFQRLLKEMTKKYVFLYDESYSTSDSYSILREQGENQKKSKLKIDRIAACHFLQELIDFKNRNNE
jgi:putative holliday junction resolvase